MNTLEKIRWLTDKVNGLGIPMTIIGKYLGYHPTTIKYYLDGAEPKPDVIEKYTIGINQLINDFNKYMR